MWQRPLSCSCDQCLQGILLFALHRDWKVAFLSVPLVPASELPFARRAIAYAARIRFPYCMAAHPWQRVFSRFMPHNGQAVTLGVIIKGDDIGQD